MFSNFKYINGMTTIQTMGESINRYGFWGIYSATTKLDKPSDFIAFADEGAWRHEFRQALKCDVEQYLAPHVLLPVAHFKTFLETLEKFSQEKKYPDFKVNTEHLMKLLINLHDAKIIDATEAKDWFDKIPTYFKSNYRPIDDKYGDIPFSLNILDRLSVEYPYGAADPITLSRYKQMFFTDKNCASEDEPVISTLC